MTKYVYKILKLNIPFITFCLMIILINSSHAVSTLRSVNQIYPDKHFDINIESNYLEDEVEMEEGQTNTSLQKKDFFYLSHKIGYTFNPDYHFALSWDYYFLKNIRHETRQKGVSDPVFHFARKFLAKMSNEPFMEVNFALSPSFENSKVATSMNQGNVKRGGHASTIGLQFGLDNSLLGALGNFYVSYYGKQKKIYLNDQSSIETKPHTSFGAESKFKYHFNFPLSLVLIGSVQVDTSHSIMTNYSAVKTTRGLTKKLGIASEYEISETKLINLDLIKSSSDYEISANESDRKLELESTLISIGIKFLL